MVKSLFDDIEFEFNCPNCDRKIKFKAKDVGKTKVCPSCSKSIFLEDDGSFSKGVKEVDKSFKDLEKTLKNLGK